MADVHGIQAALLPSTALVVGGNGERGRCPHACDSAGGAARLDAARWFDQPLTWSRGARFEAIATLNGADTLLPPSGSPLPPQVVDGTPVRVTFDVIPTPQPAR